MRQTEFNNWVEYVKGVFPKFNPTSELYIDAWRDALKNVSLDRAKSAVKQYVVEVSSKFEPQPKDIKAILQANIPVEEVTTTEKVEENYPEKRFFQDIKLGICRHNLYIYQEAYRLYGKDDFETSLEKVCLRRTGDVAEFPSDEQLKGKGINPFEKIPVEDLYKLLEIFKAKKCQL